MFRILSQKTLATMRLCRLVSSEPVLKHINDILSTHLQIGDNTLEEIKKYLIGTIICKVPRKQIIANCKTIQSMGVNLEEVAFLSHCLRLNPVIIKNRISVLKQLGVKSIGLNDIYRFPGLMRKPLKAFKAKYNISKEEYITKNMFANVGISIDDITALEMEYKYRAHVGRYYQQCVFHYKTMYLKLNRKACTRTRMKYQSFAQITELVYILKKDCNLTTEFLNKHPQLLRMNTNNIRELLAMGEYIQLNGMTILDIIKRYPHVLRYHASKVQEVLELEKALGLKCRGLFIYTQVLKMDKKKFLDRYINITNNYELSLWSQHSSTLEMIYRYTLIMKRVAHLKHLNCIHQANNHTFVSSKKFFTRFVEGDVERSVIKMSFKYLLRRELGESNVFLVNSIVTHPHWKHVPLLRVRDTLQYLKEHFTVKDICQNIHIILYPRSRVISELNLVKSKLCVKTGYDFTTKQHLALCLYQLEKTCHFSGDGIWETVNTEILDNKSHCFQFEEEKMCYI